MNAIPNLTASLTPSVTAVTPAAERVLGYHGAVCDFKRRLIEAQHSWRQGRSEDAERLGHGRQHQGRVVVVEERGVGGAGFSMVFSSSRLPSES